jgi:hypothetical protein
MSGSKQQDTLALYLVMELGLLRGWHEAQGLGLQGRALRPVARGSWEEIWGLIPLLGNI